MNDFKVGNRVECVEGYNLLKRFIEGIISAHAIPLVKHDDTNLPTNHPKLPEKKANEKIIDKFTPETFSVLNESDAEKHIGKVMEFADHEGVRDDYWIKAPLLDIHTNGDYIYPFRTKSNSYSFCRTCPETFKTKDLKKIKSIKESIACLKSELERLEGE